MTAVKRTTDAIGNQAHPGERPKNPAAAWASYCERRAGVSTENFAESDGTQGIEVVFI